MSAASVIPTTKQPATVVDVVVLPPVNPADDAARLITAAWRQSVASIIETGRLLVQAKRDLPHGEFGRMVAEKCPFGMRTAQTLMKIAAHPVLSDAQRIALLPPAWGTLAELAKIKPAKLSNAMRDNFITPETTREDAIGLRRRYEKTPDKQPTEFDPEKSASRFRVRVEKMVESWPPDQIDVLVGVLRDALRTVQTSGARTTPERLEQPNPPGLSDDEIHACGVLAGCDDEAFEDAIAQARAEGDLSHDNVERLLNLSRLGAKGSA